MCINFDVSNTVQYFGDADFLSGYGNHQGWNLKSGIPFKVMLFIFAACYREV